MSSGSSPSRTEVADSHMATPAPYQSSSQRSRARWGPDRDPPPLAFSAASSRRIRLPTLPSDNLWGDTCAGYAAVTAGAVGWPVARYLDTAAMFRASQGSGEQSFAHMHTPGGSVWSFMKQIADPLPSISTIASRTLILVGQRMVERHLNPSYHFNRGYLTRLRYILRQYEREPLTNTEPLRHALSKLSFPGEANVANVMGCSALAGFAAAGAVTLPTVPVFCYSAQSSLRAAYHQVFPPTFAEGVSADVGASVSSAFGNSFRAGSLALLPTALLNATKFGLYAGINEVLRLPGSQAWNHDCALAQMTRCLQPTPSDTTPAVLSPAEAAASTQSQARSQGHTSSTHAGSAGVGDGGGVVGAGGELPNAARQPSGDAGTSAEERRDALEHVRSSDSWGMWGLGVVGKVATAYLSHLAAWVFVSPLHLAGQLQWGVTLSDAHLMRMKAAANTTETIASTTAPGKERKAGGLERSIVEQAETKRGTAAPAPRPTVLLQNLKHGGPLYSTSNAIRAAVGPEGLFGFWVKQAKETVRFASRGRVDPLGVFNALSLVAFDGFRWMYDEAQMDEDCDGVVDFALKYFWGGDEAATVKAKPALPTKTKSNYRGQFDSDNFDESRHRK